MQTMSDKITTITAAAGTGQPIGFCYQKQVAEFFGGVSRPVSVSERRQLLPDPEDPIRYNQAGEAYVIGTDLARGETRSFTLSKITEVTIP